MPPMASKWSAMIIVIFTFGHIESNVGLTYSDCSTEEVSACRALVDAERNQRQPVGCTLPNIVHSRLAYESDNTITLSQGATVPHFTLIVYQCDPEYFRVGAQFNLCINGHWYQKTHAICTKFCPNEKLRGITFTAACVRNGFTVPCDDPITPGTVARISCRKQYRKRILMHPETLVCQDDGQWDNEVLLCDPVCGDLVTRTTPFIANGEFATRTFVPWYVAVYTLISDQKHGGGVGTILSANIVISGARYFVNTYSRAIDDRAQYAIGAGKYMDRYESNDPKAQFRMVKDILLPPGFSFDNLNAIALLLLESPLHFTTLISPVCIDWTDTNYDRLKSASVKVYVFKDSGEFENAVFPVYMRFYEIKSSDYGNCSDLISNTKFCETDGCEKISCFISIGSGFTIEKLVRGKSKHHLYGIAGMASVKRNNYTLEPFINIQNYKTFITSTLLSYLPK